MCKTFIFYRSIFVLTIFVLAIVLYNCTIKDEKDLGNLELTPKIPVISYIRTWPIHVENIPELNDKYWGSEIIKGNLITTLILAFGHIDGNNIYIPFPNFIFDEVTELKSKFSHLKINLSIGGWGAEGFSDMALTTESRRLFILDVVKLIKEKNLDGVDIDWEYPVGPPWGGLPIKTRPEDAKNYVALLSELREALDSLSIQLNRTLTLATAIPASSWFINAINILEVQKYVDFLGLMSYDYYGTWTATTGHISNLYDNPVDPNSWSTDKAVSLYLRAGVKPQKLLLGIPFYGRGWQGVSPTNNGLYQQYKKAIYTDGISYSDIKGKILKDSTFIRYWDDIAKAPFLFNGDIWISYEDEESIDYKVKYVKEKGLAGIMIWEYCDDINGDLFKSLNKSINGLY